jgi:FtsZ-interacting cell division protein ZipA
MEPLFSDPCYFEQSSAGRGPTALVSQRHERSAASLSTRRLPGHYIPAGIEASAYRHHVGARGVMAAAKRPSARRRLSSTNSSPQTARTPNSSPATKHSTASAPSTSAPATKHSTRPVHHKQRMPLTPHASQRRMPPNAACLQRRMPPTPHATQRRMPPNAACHQRRMSLNAAPKQGCEAGRRVKINTVNP